MERPLDEDFANIDKTNFEFYRDFLSIEDAKEFVAMLDQKNIVYSLETSETILDTAIVGNGLIPKAILKLNPLDFKLVNRLIEAQINQLKYSDLKDHYLNQFSNEELEEIFDKQEEWTIEDITIAQKILEGRGIKIDKKSIQDLRENSFNKIQRGRSGSRFWIVFYSLGIAFGLVTTLFLIIAGLGMSYYYAYGKNTDSDGTKYFIFDESTRQIGVIMLYGGIALIIIEFLLISYIF